MTNKSPMLRIRALALMMAVLLVTQLFAAAPTASAAGSVYRALIIGNNAYVKSPLKGCINDAKGMRSALQASSGITYKKIELKTDLNAAQLTRAISDIRDWGVDENDVTVIYYSGHGYRDSSTKEASLVGTDLNLYTFDKMERALEQIPGRLIVLLDCCYSGSIIAKSGAKAKSVEKEDLEAYNQSILNAFEKPAEDAKNSGGAQSKALSGSRYHVITAASASELSYEAGGYGHFTTGLTEAMGWNITGGKLYSKMLGDINNDGTLTITEAYTRAASVVKDLRKQGDQNVQMSPSGSTLGLVAREQAEESSTPGNIVAPSTVSGQPNLSTAILSVGHGIQLLSSTKGLTWKSTAPSIATVSSSGKVAALKLGKAVITGSKSGKTYVTCRVGVMESNKVVSKIALNASSVSRRVGSTFRLKATLTPSTAYRKQIRWFSSNTSIATVTSDGLVKPLKKGQVKIYGISSSGILASCSLTVTSTQVTRVEQKSDKATLKIGKKLQMQAKVFPEQASNRSLAWSTTDSTVIKVNSTSGMALAIGTGKAYVTATATDGSDKSSKCLVTVTK